MNFKVLTNVRAPKSTKAEVETTPTSGNVKLNSLTCSQLDIANGDYAGIAENDGKLYVFKGHKGGEGKANFGSKAASASGNNAGSMQFSSENAYQELGGTKESKRIFEVSADGIKSDGVTYYELTHVRDEVKVARKKAKAHV